ncbi:hypothetical protein FHR56_003742 [Xanthomonas sacchari]|nr:hypothetical protein [Xanthomonas sp. F10]
MCAAPSGFFPALAAASEGNPVNQKQEPKPGNNNSNSNGDGDGDGDGDDYGHSDGNVLPSNANGQEDHRPPARWRRQVLPTWCYTLCDQCQCRLNETPTMRGSL